MKRSGWSQLILTFAVVSACSLMLPNVSSATPVFYCKFRNWVADIDNVLDQTLGLQKRTCTYTLGEETWSEDGVGPCLYRQWTNAFLTNRVGVVNVQVENLVNPLIPVSFTILSRPVSMWEPQTGNFRPWRAFSRYRDFYLLLHFDDPKPASQWLTHPEVLSAIAGQRDPRFSDIALVVDSTKQQVDDLSMLAAGRLSFYVEGQQDEPVYNVNFTTNWGVFSGGPGSSEPLRPSPQGCTEPRFKLNWFSKKAFDVQLEAK